MSWIDAIRDWMYPARIPRWVIREMCDPRETRYELGFPFRQAGKAYATDGRISIEIDKHYGVELDEKTPDVAEIFADYWTKQGAWLDWKGLPESTGQEATCLTCFGRAVQGVYLPCATCIGDQYVWTEDNTSDMKIQDLRIKGGEFQYLVKCLNCVAGYEGKPCAECNGTGVIAGAPDAIRIDSRLIDRKYYYLVSCLPDAEFVSRPDKQSVVVFRFHGGRGLLQPLTERNYA